MRGLSFLISLLLLWGSAEAALTAKQQVDLRGVQELILQGECDAAFTKLAMLRQQAPTAAEIKLALRDVFVCKQQYDSAQIILDELIATASQPLIKAEYIVATADLHLKQGDKLAGDSIMQSAIAIAPTNDKVYQLVAQTYMTDGYYNDAVATYLEARRALNDDFWFARELGRLYEVMRDYGDAAREYFRAVVGDTLQARYVVDRVASMVAEHAAEDFDTGLGEELRKIAEEYPGNNYAQKFYADFLMTEGRHQEALRCFIVSDSLGKEEGSQLVHFCLVASEAGDAQAVALARQELRKRYPDSPHISNAGFILGGALFEAGDYDAAIAVYRELADSSDQTADRSQALLMLGYTLFQGRNDPTTALAVFDDLIDDFARLPGTQIARLFAADCHLALGEVELADSLYESIALNSLPQQYQEELLFRRGEFQFLLGEYDPARTEYGKLMQAFPKSVYVNDCLRRIMLISEHPEMAALELKIYSDALFATFRFDYDSALVLYEKLEHRSDSTLAMLSWFAAAEIKEQQGLHTEALATFDSLLALYPASFYAPLAVEKKADIFAFSLNDYQQAEALYEQVLLDYPKSLNLEEVRKKLRRMKQLGDRQLESSKS
ncbi:MAG: tetratricopeptide repeat protein [bacterium]